MLIEIILVIHIIYRSRRSIVAISCYFVRSSAKYEERSPETVRAKFKICLRLYQKLRQNVFFLDFRQILTFSGPQIVAHHSKKRTYFISLFAVKLNTYVSPINIYTLHYFIFFCL